MKLIIIFFINILLTYAHAIDLVRDYPNNTNSFFQISAEKFDQRYYKKSDVEIIYNYFNNKYVQGGWGNFISRTNNIIVLKVKNLNPSKKFFIQYDNSNFKTLEIKDVFYAGSDQNGYDYFHAYISLDISNLNRPLEYKIITLQDFKFKDPGGATYGRENVTWFDGYSGLRYDIDVNVGL